MWRGECVGSEDGLVREVGAVLAGGAGGAGVVDESGEETE